MNAQLYHIKCYSSCFFFSFLEQNCSAFTIEILITVIKNAFLFSFLFLFFLYAMITLVYLLIEIFRKILFISLFLFDDWCHLMLFKTQWNLFKADTYRTEVFIHFREVSALERFEPKSSQI